MNITRNKACGKWLAGVAALWLTLASTSGFAHDSSIASPYGKTFGKTYSEWAADWWTWVLKTPVLLPRKSHPALDKGYVDCSIGQRGKVWFIGANFGVGENFDGSVKRSCVIPSDIALFFPLLNNIYINFVTDPPFTAQICSESNQAAIASLGKLRIRARIDDEWVDNPKKFFEESPIFKVQLPVPDSYKTNLLAHLDFTGDNFWPGWEARENCDAGWYLLVKNLKPGKHDIYWRVTNAKGDVLNEVAYQLIVKRSSSYRHH